MLTLLCITSFHKGFDFLREAKRQGARVILLTSKSLEQAEWPKESIDEIYYIPDVDKEWNMNDVISGVSYMARTVHFDKIVALDDFDVEKAAALREHLRFPGMGDSTARHFRDKLAMRTKAADVGIPVPAFVHILNYEKIKAYLASVPPPYVLKPRMQAGAIGISKIHNEQELWDALSVLGDKQSFYLLEQFTPGDVFHVDSILFNREIVFSIVSKYGRPPMEVAHEGRVFSSRTLQRGSPDEAALQALNKHTLKSLGLLEGVSHTEFIKSDLDGKYYFLETSARVGGANIADMVEAASGLNLWAEWAKIETCPDGKYHPKPLRHDYACIMISLAKQEWPDLASYNDPEVVWRLNKKHHAGLIFRSPNHDRVEELLTNYTGRFYQDFFATVPLPDKATE
ncbi:MAG: ATP-grasp domain-containing protein [Ignavibacteriae bacterium]|nr:ATP-grasp domain-containing protein [Ignavibacteriota bacterium]